MWVGVGILVALVLGGSAQPLLVGWRCYALHANGEHTRADVVARLDAPALVLRVTEGSRAGQACTATTSSEHHAALTAGDALAVVVRPDVPGECVLEATLENSIALLGSVTGGVAAAVGLALLCGLLAHRSLGRAPARYARGGAS